LWRDEVIISLGKPAAVKKLGEFVRVASCDSNSSRY